MIVYGLKNCDKCRLAVRSLQAQGYVVTFTDLRREPAGAVLLAEWWHSLGAVMLNRRSTTWRGLSQSAQETNPLELMLEHPSLIKRPIIVADDGTISCGWDSTIREKFGISA